MFQKKGNPSQQQPNFTSSYDKHGGINTCSFNFKKTNFQTKNLKMYPCKEDKEISPRLKTADRRSGILGFNRRFQIPFHLKSVQEKAPKLPNLNQEHQKLVDR